MLALCVRHCRPAGNLIERAAAAGAKLGAGIDHAHAGLVDAQFSGGKQTLRDRLRRLPEGELAWQKLQGRVYGAHMPLAVGGQQSGHNCSIGRMGKEL